MDWETPTLFWSTNCSIVRRWPFFGILTQKRKHIHWSPYYWSWIHAGPRVNNQISELVAFVSQTTHRTEFRCPQLDLDVVGFVGSLLIYTLVSDHELPCPIFNDNQEGLIWAEKIRMRYQHIRYKVVYKKGKLNQTGFILRRGKPYILIYS